MSMSLNEIQQAIAALKSSDLYHLWCWLDDELGDRESEAPAEAAWDTEIARRLKEIQGGQVQLIPGEEFDRRTTELFRELGINRRSKLAHLRSEIAIGLNQADVGDFANFTAAEGITRRRTRRTPPPLDNPSEMR